MSERKAKAKTKIIVVVNQKGGVGKSTVAFHLAHAAAKKGRRVLGIDLDAQGNFSQYLTADLDVINQREGGAGALLGGVDFTPSETTHPDIDLLHAHVDLDQYDKDEEVLERGYSASMRLYLLDLGYDYIIIDTPGDLGFRPYAALCWSDTAVIPMDPAMTSIAGFQNVLKAIDEHVTKLNPDLKWMGVLSRVDSRIRSHREKGDWVKETYGKQILPMLTARSAVAEAMEESPAQPVWLRKGVPKELREKWLAFCKLVITG